MNRIIKNTTVILCVTSLCVFIAFASIEAKGAKQRGIQRGTHSMNTGSEGKGQQKFYSTNRQHLQLRSCTQFAEQVRTRARNIEQQPVSLSSMQVMPSQNAISYAENSRQ
jgi:hypothetical protein